jgi:hypothetical protein
VNFSVAVIAHIVFSFLLGITSASIFQRFNNIFFYNVFFATFVTIIGASLQLRFSKKRFFVVKPIRSYLVVICGLLTFSFLATVPLTIDRSYSVWLLKHITEVSASNQKIPESVLIEDSVAFFAPENEQLNRRIHEQKRLGNLVAIEPGLIQITPKGKLLAQLNSWIGSLFGLDPKYSKLHLSKL